METPVIINCVVGAIVTIATIFIAGATVVNMKINKTMKEVMKISTNLHLLSQTTSMATTQMELLYRSIELNTSKGEELPKEKLEKINKNLESLNKTREKAIESLEAISKALDTIK